MTEKDAPASRPPLPPAVRWGRWTIFLGLALLLGVFAWAYVAPAGEAGALQAMFWPLLVAGLALTLAGSALSFWPLLRR